MLFPPHTDKPGQYAECAYILAETFGELGHPISEETQLNWDILMRRIAVADDISEQDPGVLRSGESLVQYLGVTANLQAITAADSLLDASRRSIAAPTLKAHLDSREDEAVHSMSLLRSQTPELLPTNVWRQADLMNIAGIFLDSFVDARDDAGELANFTARQLLVGSAMRFAATIGRMDKESLRVITAVSARHGFARHCSKEIMRRVCGIDLVRIAKFS